MGGPATPCSSWPRQLTSLSTVPFEGSLFDVPRLSITPNPQTAMAEAVVLVDGRTRVNLPWAGEAWTDAEPIRYRIKARRSLAEHLAEMPKGIWLLVAGTMVPETWTDQVCQEEKAQNVAIADGVSPSPRQGDVHISSAVGSRDVRN